MDTQDTKEKKTPIKDIITKNITWVIALGFMVITLWLNSKYVTKEEHETFKTKTEKFMSDYNTTEKGVIMKQDELESDITVVDERLDKKIKLQKEMQQIQNDLENRIIILETKDALRD